VARRVLLYLAGMVGLTALSVIVIVIFGNSIQISCAREAGQAPDCRITRMLLGRVSLSSRDVLGVSAVRLEESCDDGCAYRAVLITSDRDGVPLNEVYTDRGPVQRQIDALSPLLNGAGASFEYVEPVQWWVVALVLGLDLLGMAIVAGSFLRESRSG